MPVGARVKLLALLFWYLRRWYLGLVVVRIPPRHPESWRTVSEIGACDRAIARLHREWSA